MSAWPQIPALGDLPDPGGNRRPKDAVYRISQMLAADPAQLHDPKSPIRSKARTYMPQSMSQRWLAGGLAVEAMTWLQTFEWREGDSGLPPVGVMLRASGYMPEIKPRDNIAAEVDDYELSSCKTHISMNLREPNVRIRAVAIPKPLGR
ncbi:hypothetical protein [Sphingomonas sp. M1A8_2b]